MTKSDKDARPVPERLDASACLECGKLLNPAALPLHQGMRSEAPVLVILAAGKGTRFGQSPKCIQPVRGIPLARHSIDAFRRFSASPVICLVGYRHADVSTALGGDNLYVRSDNPTGGTAFAAFEAFCVPGLLEANPLLILTMGDRIVTPSVYRRLAETHAAGGREADLTFLTAVYEPPRNQGKGRVVRDDEGGILRIVEQRDIDSLADAVARRRLHNLTEGNCPLYAIRAALLHRCLGELTNDNAQGQYYLTDIVEAVRREGGDIRTISTSVADPEYDLLCSDLTRPMDLALLESVLAQSEDLLFPAESEAEEAARIIRANRPPAQAAAIGRQIGELLAAVEREELSFRPDQPVAVGISGGRLRIAFMHPDMGRFFGPAWQMPIGAGTPDGDEQIVVLAQSADDRQIHLFPTNPRYRENVNVVAGDMDAMYPGETVTDWHTYEEFGTRLTETVLLSLGYFSDEELQRRRKQGLPLPPPSLWVASNMRRPFSLIGNAIASLRTLHKGRLGARVQESLGRDGFRGLRFVSTGNIPQGGFSSSSAVTVAAKNAINALFDLGIPPDLLVHLACQAEYGTGVRAGSLDQATEQKGRAGEGTLVSSNPRDNYRILGTYRMPAERIHVFFPYTVDRDRLAWRWSWGSYAESPGLGRPTTVEIRKLTGKAAEMAALLIQLPVDADFFKQVESDLLERGEISLENRTWTAGMLRRLPLLILQDDLRDRLRAHRAWYLDQLIEAGGLDPQTATLKADTTLNALFAGWRDPVLRRATASGEVIEETGVPLRTMVAYLFAEVARNFRLMHQPDRWIQWVTASQRGDCCVEIPADGLPSRQAMEGELAWERGLKGAERMNRWMERVGAAPFDHQRGLDDAALSVEPPPLVEDLPGANFFRGLALIDLAEAMLKRAFGRDAVAVRVNAAGQGDFFQVHVDTGQAAPDEVKGFLRRAFYRRFGLSPQPEFVEVHSGGGAAGVRLNRYDELAHLAEMLAGKSVSAAGTG